MEAPKNGTPISTTPTMEDIEKMSEEGFAELIAEAKARYESEIPVNRTGIHANFQRAIASALTAGKPNVYGPLCAAFQKWADAEATMLFNTQE